jgi:hypothetical protein
MNQIALSLEADAGIGHDVVDVDAWLERSASRVRPFTPQATQYVPRHRAEPVG